ncbi:MAG: Ig-like domain-containing protein [Luteolibacter sp.]
MIRLPLKLKALCRLIIPFIFLPVGTTTAAVLNSPSQAAVNAAIGCNLISYGTWYSGGAYTNGSFYGGASIVLAVASYAGNTTADARLLQQIRHTLTPGNEICANGGYPAQHERHVTGMFAIVKNTPRIWSQLTAAEKNKIDLMMKAAFVASAFTTSNNNPYLSSQRTLDADFNLGRDWNPNYREGMLGGVLVGMVYFGGPTAADAILNNYNHSQFVAELNAAGLPNTYQVFNWKAANPSSAAPSGTDIETGVRNYKYYNSGLADYAGLYNSLVNDTYGKNVNSGLNNGAGIGGAGKINTGAATLPNLGAPGMLKEFDSSDGGGPRSALVYAYDGYRPHQTNQLVLIIGGYWQSGGTIANNAVSRMKTGNTDLFYKLDHGYIDYASGSNRGLVGEEFRADHGVAYVSSLWYDVLLPYHDGATGPVNTAPVATADSYVAGKDTALVLAAPGVLGNDTDAQANPLTAALDAGPGHGSVTLNANGGFTYTPAAGYTGPDSFTYHANDGGLDSNVAAVSISVQQIASGSVFNGSFESDFTGWTTSGNLSIQSAAPYAATSGLKLVSFNQGDGVPNGILSQAFATIPGRGYTLSFDVGVLSYNTSPQSMQVTVTGAGGLLSQTITLNGLGGGSNRWVAQYFTFVADGSTAILNFRDVSPSTSNLDLLLDNVRVVADAVPGADSDGDGTDDATEIRLGLNPASGSSRFAVTVTSGALQWPSATGLTFVVQRSTGTTGIVWETIATVPGTAGTRTYTDPSPPPGTAFYRVGLNP